VTNVRPETTFRRYVPFPPVSGLLDALMMWDARFRARCALAALAPERCADLGLACADIESETAKPIWSA
jgi:uncharacterized protein YjiS (DUF1127 family)